MDASSDINNNTLYHVKDPEVADQATNKKYVDNQLEKKNWIKRLTLIWKII